MLKLYYARGACSLASHFALEEAGADYVRQRVDLRGGEQRGPDYLKINPKGRVPALATDQGVLTENPAILAYVAQLFPAARLAPPADSFAFAEMQAFNQFLCTTVHVSFAHNSRPERYADGEEAHRAMRAKVPPTLAAAFGLIEARLGDGRPFVMGADYTVADGYLHVFERWQERDRLIDPADYPLVGAHRERVAARPAVQAVLAAEAED